MKEDKYLQWLVIIGLISLVFLILRTLLSWFSIEVDEGWTPTILIGISTLTIGWLMYGFLVKDLVKTLIEDWKNGEYVGLFLVFGWVLFLGIPILLIAKFIIWFTS